MSIQVFKNNKLVSVHPSSESLIRPVSPGIVLLEAKLNRKKTENDLQAISNRISLLKVEEEKALQKIKETKDRGKEILSIRQRNDNQLLIEIELHRRRQIEIEEVARKAAEARAERNRRIQASKDHVLQSKKQLAIEIKQAEKIWESKSIDIKLESRIEKKNKAQELRTYKEKLRKKQEQERLDKLFYIQSEYNNKIKQEYDKQNNIKQLIERLEIEEKELVNRLKKTQELQQQAYEILERSLDS